MTQNLPPGLSRKKAKKKKGKVKATGAGLEGFIDWADSNANSPTEEREDDMSSLAAEFIARMRKHAAQGETASDFEVYGAKRPKRSGPEEEAQKSLMVITVDSL